MDQAGGGGGDGVAGEPELHCAVGAKGGPAVHDGGGDGAGGKPELRCTAGADGEPTVTGGSDAEGKPDPLHTSISSWVDAESEPTRVQLPDAYGEPGHTSLLSLVDADSETTCEEKNVSFTVFLSVH